MGPTGDTGEPGLPGTKGEIGPACPVGPSVISSVKGDKRNQGGRSKRGKPGPPGPPGPPSEPSKSGYLTKTKLTSETNKINSLFLLTCLKSQQSNSNHLTISIVIIIKPRLEIPTKYSQNPKVFLAIFCLFLFFKMLFCQSPEYFAMGFLFRLMGGHFVTDFVLFWQFL
jgi:hypothetical protein